MASETAHTIRTLGGVDRQVAAQLGDVSGGLYVALRE
jgi:hypothetical protein